MTTSPKQSSRATSDVPAKRSRVWLVIGLALITLNLRPAVSAVAALLKPITSGLGLSGTAVGVLTILPTAGLSVFAFLGPRLSVLWGEKRLIAVSGLLLLTGSLARLLPSTVALFTGTVLIAAAIGLATGAIPGLIKRDFAGSVAPMMALYTITLTIAASVAAGVAAPLAAAMHSSWWLSLAVITVPLAVLAVLWWSPELARSRPRRTYIRIPSAVWSDALAWQVTTFFASTAFVYFFVINWLPTVAHDRGMGSTASGLMLAVVALVQVAGSLAVPAVIKRTRGQRSLAVVIAVVNMVGLMGVMVAPLEGEIWAAAVVLGLGQGGGFGLAMTLIGLRASDAPTASGLSGMTQGMGYMIAAAGPFIAGLLHSATDGWLSVLVVLVMVCIAQLVAGLGAGRTREVLADW